MVRREPNDHCNFCEVKTKGINRKNRNLTYPNLDSAVRPVPHSEELPVPSLNACHNWNLLFPVEYVSIDSDNTLAGNDFSPSLLTPQLFSQELNDLARDLNLTKESSELLVSRFKKIF